MNDIQLQMSILLYREHLAELQRKPLELGQQLRASQQTIAHSCKLLAGLDALLADVPSRTVQMNAAIAVGLT
jgi:hypothetical protein